MNTLTWRPIALQLLILLALIFGIVAWTHRPEGAWIWLAGMLAMPLAWGLISLFGAMPSRDRPKERIAMFNSLLSAGLMIAGALGASALGTLETISEDWITRFYMVTIALMLIVIGNGLPKKEEDGCSPTRSTAIKRLVGWTMVLGGLILALTWLLAPLALDVLGVLTFVIYATMAGVIGIGLWRIRNGASNGSPTT